MAFDFQLNGTLNVPSSAINPSFSSFSGTFIPEPVSTYTFPGLALFCFLRIKR